MSVESITTLSKHIHQLSKGDRASKLLYLACLKEVGKIAKIAYRIKPTEQFKQNILALKKKIEDYAIN